MNLTFGYLWIHEFVKDKHITVAEPFDYSWGQETIKIPEGIHGKIISLDRKAKTLEVFLEDGKTLKDVHLGKFTIRRELDAKTAYDLLHDFFGHYSIGEQVYQFNIKMHRLNIPDIAYKHFTSEKIWDIIYDEFSFAIDSFIGKNNPDATLNHFVWIRDYYIKGKSGGYLMIEDSVDVKDYYDDAEYRYLEALSDYADDEEYVEDCYEDLKSEENDLIERVYDLLMIRELIKVEQENLYSYLNNPDFWLECLEYLEA